MGDITGKLSSLGKSSDYSVYAGGDKIAEKSEGSQKRLEGPGVIGRRIRSMGSDCLDPSGNKK